MGKWRLLYETDWIGLSWLIKSLSSSFHWPEKRNFYIFMTDYEKNKQSRWGGIIFKKKKSKLKDKRKITLGHLPVGSVPDTLLFLLCPHSAVPSFRESEGKQHQQHLTQVRGWTQDRPNLTGLVFIGCFWKERIVISEHLRPTERVLFFLFLCVGLLFKEPQLYNQVTSLTRERSPWIRSMKNK